MATEVELKGDLPKFDPNGDPTSTAPRWKRWKRAFELFAVGKGIKDTTQKRALMLHTAGMEVQDIFDTLPDTGEEKDYDKAISALDAYFSPAVNVPFERHMFRRMSQKENETIDQFITRLKQKALTCDYGDSCDEFIRDQVIDACNSTPLRRKLLEKGHALTLETLQEVSRAHEASYLQASRINNDMPSDSKRDEVNATSKGGNPKYSSKQDKSASIKCHRCGNPDHLANSPSCPAKNRKCNKCSKIGHYASVCKTKTDEKDKGVNSVTDETEKIVEDNEYAFIIDEPDNSMNNDGIIDVKVGGVSCDFLIDSGSTCNIVDRSTWEKMKFDRIACKSEKSNTRIFAYGQDKPLNAAGKFIANVEYQGTTLPNTEFLVIEGSAKSILGKDTSLKLNVLRVGPKIRSPDVNYVEDDSSFRKRMIATYSACFEGVGKLKDRKLKININPEVKPVAQKARKIPYGLQSKVEDKLKELENKGIIEKVEGPAKWASPLVVVPKSNGDIRLCTDMRRANEAIIREKFPIPTVDDILHEINGSKVFSKLDLKWGYHQLELDEDSRDITTTVTHKGHYRYTRLIFGMNNAAEYYQYHIGDAIRDCAGAHNISDDIIVHGNDQAEHDLRLEGLLQTLQEKNLTLNPEKCQFRMTKITFMGYLLSERGIGPTSSNVEAVKNARRPESASEVRSFLGLVNFSARFIPDLSTTAEPLRELTKKDVKFEWKRAHEEAFSKLKDKLSHAQTLAYFDKNAKTKIVADASPVGLGAVLIQEQNGVEQVVSYASRSLTGVERRYSQTEKEALALVWACERFHMYLYGITFELITDHKPLEVIYSRNSTPSARIQRWVLRLQSYDFTVKYRPGAENIADALSRLSLSQAEVTDDAEEYVRFVARNAVPNAITIQEVERESDIDPELAAVRKCILTDSGWETVDVSYRSVRQELCVLGKLVVRGTRLVIPRSLQKNVLDLAHRGHQGIVKTKERLRSKVWWPNIDKEAERVCRTCHGCQVTQLPSKPEPIVRTKLPTSPWEVIACDLLGPIGSDTYVLAVIDYYSRWIEFDILKTITSSRIIKSLDKMFLTHGLPFEMTTDNAPNLASSELEDYCKERGIDLRHITPLWPQANAEIERQMRNLNKAIQIAHAEGAGDLEHGLNEFVTAYRTTPHCTTGKSPDEMLFGRRIRTRIPDLSTLERYDGEARDRDLLLKQRGKEYADCKAHAKVPDIRINDKVLLQQKKTSKTMTNFEHTPYDVVDVKGSQVTIKSDEGVCYKRNSSHLRKFEEPTSIDESDDMGVKETKSGEPQRSTEPSDTEEVEVELRRSARCNKGTPPDRLKY